MKIPTIDLDLHWDSCQQGPIGVFDSGYGGLTVLKELQSKFPTMDFIYLGDNARSPYGTRSFETIYHYSLEAVKHLFNSHCPLIISACNTASAKALRSIQQIHLGLNPTRRVLGIIRPMTEFLTENEHPETLILGTPGTIQSNSYLIELHKFAPSMKVHQKACPMWVPLVENEEIETPASEYFTHRYIDEALTTHPGISRIVLACTHYPLLKGQVIQSLLQMNRSDVEVIIQGPVVADKLEGYLGRHPEMLQKISTHSTTSYHTTETSELFDARASRFLGSQVKSKHVYLEPTVFR
jgi:glutamate racemase